MKMISPLSILLLALSDMAVFTNTLVQSVIGVDEFVRSLSVPAVSVCLPRSCI
jgi:hypothetical protein